MLNDFFFLDFIGFNADVYLRLNPDVAQAGCDPLEHFLNHGRLEHRSIRDETLEALAKATKFDAPFYLKCHADVAASGLDPLVHFARHGIVEGRAWSPNYDYWGDATLLSLVDPSGALAGRSWRDKQAALRALERERLEALIVEVASEEKWLFRRGVGLLLGYAALVARAPLLSEAFFRSYYFGLPYTSLSGHNKIVAVCEVSTVADYAVRLSSQPNEVRAPVRFEMAEPEVLPSSAAWKEATLSASLPRAVSCELGCARAISGTSMILTSDRILLYDDAAGMMDDPDRDLRNPLVLASTGLFAAVILPDVTDHVKSAYVLFDDHSHNYFHFLLEVIPKLEFVNLSVSSEAVIEDDFPYQYHQALEIMMSKELSLRRISRYATVEIDRAIVFSSMGKSVVRVFGQPRHDDYVVSPSSIDFVRNKTTAQRQASGRVRLLYVTRTKPQFRRILNHDVVRRGLSNLGFEVVDPSALTFAEQVSVFWDAKVIVADAGAALANVVFCQPYTEILVLTNADPATNYYVFAQLATASGAHLRYFKGWKNAKSHEVPVQCDYIVNVDELLALVREAIGCRVGSDAP